MPKKLKSKKTKYKFPYFHFNIFVPPHRAIAMVQFGANVAYRDVPLQKINISFYYESYLLYKIRLWVRRKLKLVPTFTANAKETKT